MKRNLHAFAAVILLVSFAYTPTIPSLAASATYYVSPDGVSNGACPTTAPCQLEYAVSLANATPELDTIYLSSGSYTKATDTTDAFLSITNSIKMVGGCVCGYTSCTPNNPDTILSGGGERRILKLDFQETGGEVILENLTLQWGNGNRQIDMECMSSEGCGGAIFVEGVEPGISLVIDQCYFWGNTARQNDDTVDDEHGAGGAIYFNNNGNLEIKNSTFYGNKAIGYGFGYGGAIFQKGAYSSIEQSTFHQNNCNWDATYGLGCSIWSFENDVAFFGDNTFTGNSINASDPLTKDGSAIYSASDQSLLTFRNVFASNHGRSTFYLGPAIAGHGIQIGLNRFWGNHTASIVQVFSTSGSTQQIHFLSNFMGTDDRYDIDGIFNTGIVADNYSASDYLFINIWNNSLGYLDRGFSFSGLENIDITNNILSHAQDATYSPDWLNISLTGSNNLFYDVDDMTNIPTVNVMVVDPLFVNGAQGDFHLTSCSPAIGAGASGLAAPIFTDIDGDPRIVGLPDIGADEYTLRTYLPITLK
ncbi:MAG: hypothetical protein R6V73_11640 [Anaerolineales bacterium]